MSPRRLLVVDDHPEFCHFVRQAGEGTGFAVASALNGAAAKLAFDASRPDVVVLDIVMPDLDGIEMVRWFGEQGYRGHVLLVTGYHAAFLHVAAALAELYGMSVASFQKPVGYDTLCDALNLA